MSYQNPHSSSSPLDHLERNARRVAPLWPLTRFVAVNPFLGHVDVPFDRAAERIAAATGETLYRPRAEYLKEIADGLISIEDVAASLGSAPMGYEDEPQDASEWILWAQEQAEATVTTHPTALSVASKTAGKDFVDLALTQLTGFAAAYFDDGQAPWRSPLAASSLFSAWLEEMTLDRSLEVGGMKSVRAIAKQVPSATEEAAAWAFAQLGIDAATLEEDDAYLYALAMSLSGFMGVARHRQWEAELRSESDDAPVELLTALLVLDAIVLTSAGAEAQAAWKAAVDVDGQAREGAMNAHIDGVLHRAYELAAQRKLAQCLESQLERAQSANAEDSDGGSGSHQVRPDVQAVFCIDVRSEAIRRGVEQAVPGSQTLGFAGFFGVPIEYTTDAKAPGQPRCPALLAPPFAVLASVKGASVMTAKAHREKASRATKFKKAFSAFKESAIGSFGFVESFGLGYAGKLAKEVGAPALKQHDHLDHRVPQLAEAAEGERDFGIGHEDRVELAEGALRGMSLTSGFAKKVLLVGHGSTSANNPYASGLDCGACGGHPGDANARAAALLLNDPAVRAGLADKGIDIPEDTRFVAVLHDTTTDALDVLGTGQDDETLTALEAQLAHASQLARAERARGCGAAPEAHDWASALSRSQDPSEVRPEWGLAGCGSFVAAPRSRTQHLDLGGRTFLHDYDASIDEDKSVLEMIMNAPMVVAAWINLQYFASSVAPRTFGSGNKTLHDIVSGIGVREGSRGDLRVGLPMQSVHDGYALQHAPQKLSAIIQASTADMSAIIERNPSLQTLLDNGWLNLFAMNAAGQVAWRYEPGVKWVAAFDAQTRADVDDAARQEALQSQTRARGAA